MNKKKIITMLTLSTMILTTTSAFANENSNPVDRTIVTEIPDYKTVEEPQAYSGTIPGETKVSEEPDVTNPPVTDIPIPPVTTQQTTQGITQVPPSVTPPTTDVPTPPVTTQEPPKTTNSGVTTPKVTKPAPQVPPTTSAPSTPPTTQEPPKTTNPGVTTPKVTKPAPVAPAPKVKPLSTPIDVNGVNVVGSYNGNIVAKTDDGTLYEVSPTKVNAKQDEKGTWFVIDKNGKKSELPKTGEKSTGILTMLGIGLLSVLTYVKKFKF